MSGLALAEFYQKNQRISSKSVANAFKVRITFDSKVSMLTSLQGRGTPLLVFHSVTMAI